MSNVIRNGGFSEGFRHWQTVGDWRIGDATDAVLLLKPGIASLAQATIDVIPEQSYSFQYSARHQGSSGLTIIIKLIDEMSENTIHHQAVTTLTNEYQTMSGVFRVPESVASVRLIFEVYYLGEETDAPEELYLDNLVIFHYQICFASGSMVMIREIDSCSTREIPASELDPDSHLVFRTDTQEFVTLEMVVRAGMTSTFFKLPRDLLGANQPNRDFLITSGHRIIYQDAETKVREIPGRQRVRLVRPDHIFTLVCQDHCPVMVNGIGVIAYGLEEWQVSRLNLITSNLIEKKRRQ